MTTKHSSPGDGPGARAQAALREEHWKLIKLEWGLLQDDHRTVQQARRNGTEPTAVEREERTVYAGFQFVEQTGVGIVVAPAWTSLRGLLTARWSDENAVLWTCSPNAYLEGGSPATEIQASPEVMTEGLIRAVEAAFAPPPWF